MTWPASVAIAAIWLGVGVVGWSDRQGYTVWVAVCACIVSYQIVVLGK